MIFIKKILFLLLPTLLFCEKIHKTDQSESDSIVHENRKIKCRWICDKRLYREKQIAEAISFYKNSKYYKFNKKNSN
jgi:hypothetical protein